MTMAIKHLRRQWAIGRQGAAQNRPLCGGWITLPPIIMSILWFSTAYSHQSSRFIRSVIFVALGVLLFAPMLLPAEAIPVRYREGSVHGYLAMRALDGRIVASGDLFQTVHGDRVISRLVYHFRDGSIDDETAVFTQRSAFRLISDRHIQKGPTFPKPMIVNIDAKTGDVTVRYWEKGQEKIETDHVDLPSDLTNGMILDEIKNVPLRGKETKMTYLASTPKPRLITLTAVPDGNDTFHSAGASRKAFRLVIKADLGGFAGWIAPLIGKQPANARVWIGAGEVPAFIRSEEPLYLGGPLLRTELTSPVWK